MTRHDDPLAMAFAEPIIGRAFARPAGARHQPLCACRCFRSEMRRMIRAFAMRTASVLVRLVFGGGVTKASVPIGVGIAGCEENGIVEP